MKPSKQMWDTRAWLIGIVGGILGGSLTAWPSYPPIQKKLNALPHPALIGGHSADIISGTAAVLSLLVLPGLLSGLSRRLTFLWGLLPLCLFLVSTELEDWYENGLASVTKEWWQLLLALAVCLLISSGPVSLIRWLHVRAKRRQTAMLASHQAMRESASVPQEGVWPPPPDYRG
ncbi:MAG: hypothetical protein ACRYFS_17005 [Janthinobacterium lividum]